MFRSKIKAIEDRTGHHIFYYLEYEGKEYKAGKLSHSARGQIDPYILGKLAKILHLSGTEFHDLVECPLGGDQFRKLWSQRKGLNR